MNRTPFLILFGLLACQPSSTSPTTQTDEAKSATNSTVKEPANTSDVVANSAEFEPANQEAGDRFWKHSNADLNTGEATNVPPPIRRIDDAHFSVGQFVVNQKEKWVRIKSKINQRMEILEYLSCGPRGKLHECVLLSYGLPSHLHLALILIGAEPGSEYGSEVSIDVEWKNPQTGKTVKHPAAHFLYDRLKLKKGENILWSFVGSRFYSGRYLANSEQSLIAVINDSNAVIGIKTIVGNAHKGPNQGFEGNKETTPPVGTPVDLYVRLASSTSSKPSTGQVE